MPLPSEPVVLITGAAARLGAASARALHARGARVLVHCRHSRERAEALAAELNAQRPDSCRVLVANLDHLDEVLRLADAALAVWGRLDGLVNNASTFRPTPLGTVTAQDWDELMASNAKAPFFLAQALATALRAQQGAIVNLIDIHAQRPLRQHTVYCMAKAALAMLTESLALELAPEVRVNGIAPGAILWPEQGDVPDPARQAAILAGIPLGHLGQPEDIARTVCFLLLDAPYITGQILGVDGGRGLR